MKISIRNFQKKIPVYPKRIKKTILKVLSKEKAKISGEITVCFVNDSRIKKLNKTFHHRDSPTDVLTFDFAEPGNAKGILVDIIISTDTALRNAKIFKTAPEYELNLYLIHGILHLLGYDDRTAKQKQLMRKKEKQYVYT